MDYTFFAMQAAVREISLRAQLHALVASTPAEMSLVDKRQYYGAITSILAPYVASFDLGYWDYIADPSKAEQEFDTWCAEIERTASAAVPDEPAQGPYRRGQGDHFLFTLAFLLQKGGSSDLVVAERCDLEEADYFTRATFAHLLATPPMLGFASVRADAFYVVPGADEDALSWEELRSEGYEYLRPLT